ncbi:MAG TPA: hypothetical protein PKI19_06265 [Elusimicrobiales bacterium]|nr:hypothetical protein [Elusimicrobiales bacterium]
MDARAGERRLLCLSGENLEGYSRALSALISAGRLNSSYPDPFVCADYISCLAPSLRRGVYDGVNVDRLSGLPVLKEVLAVKIDKDLAPAYIASQQERLAAGLSLAERAAAKLEYLKRLVAVDLKPLNRLDVKLRRVDRRRGSAFFEVIYDAYALSPAGFTRYTLQLEQKDAVWSNAFLERSGDYSEPTGEFRLGLEKYAQDESELLFLILGGIKGMRVEQICRARIGPFWSACTGFPRGWPPGPPGSAAVLHFPVDRASVELDGDINNDPFEGMYREFLSGEAKDLIAERVKDLGYRVHKDRKFACTQNAEPALRKMLAASDCRNIIYAI